MKGLKARHSIINCSLCLSASNLHPSGVQSLCQLSSTTKTIQRWMLTQLWSEPTPDEWLHLLITNQVSQCGFPAKTFGCRLTHKLSLCYIGPLSPLTISNPSAVKLSLPEKLKTHSSFNVSQLQPVSVSTPCPPSRPSKSRTSYNGNIISKHFS